jgi:thymidine kinase
MSTPTPTPAIICKPICGRLELILGPMFASKTTELIRIADRYRSIGKNILAINHSINNRYGTNQISSHDMRVMNDCIISDRLSRVFEENRERFDTADVIIIEELQFFTDCYEIVTDWVDNYHKIVVAAGLDGDFKREPFGNVYKLIPHAEKLVKLRAFCSVCCDGTHAHFSQRIVKNDATTVVGSSETYRAVCRYHYLNPDAASNANPPH